MKWFILTTIFAAALLSGGCDPLNPYALSGPQGDEDTTDTTSQDATGTSDITTTDSGVETTDTSADDTPAPIDPCEACASDEVCWDGVKCVDPAWVTLVTEEIPGTWTQLKNSKTDTVNLTVNQDDYVLGDFPGTIQYFSAFLVDPDGTVDFVLEHNGAHVTGSFQEIDGFLHFDYTYIPLNPNKSPSTHNLVRTSP